MTAADASRRAMILYGTDEPVVPMRRLTAGRLTVELDRGNLRYVGWGGFEVLRAIAFIVRDTNWGTCDAALADLAIEEDARGFAVRYAAEMSGPDGTFRYQARISGSAEGRLSFHATGASSAGFGTNRTGFVVLHPLKGVVGHAVDVEHASGHRSTALFPDLIAPKQPVFDIRALSHTPAPGLRVTVRMEGDAFEMEDHRNWTDASFKTYVRPLARGFPYTIPAGEMLDQRVTLTVAGDPPASRSLRSFGAVVRLGEAAGVMPAIGISVLPSEVANSLRIAGKLAALSPSYVVARIDARGDLNELADIAALAKELGRPLALDIVIPGKSPADELVGVAQAIQERGLAPASVFVVPARDLRGRPPNAVPEGEADPATILAAARRAFPSARIGGGMTIAFTEFNRNRPPAGIDFITHATQATVHAADDVSVMETLEALPDVIRSARAIGGSVPYRLGLATIGAPAETYYAPPAENPDNRRITQAVADPRQRGLFAAAYALGYVAIAAQEGVESLTLAASSGPAGLFAADGTPFPLAIVLENLAALAGQRRISVTIEGDAKLASIATDKVLWLANLSANRVEVEVPHRAFTTIRCFDADALAGPRGVDAAERPFTESRVSLDAYAICRLA